MTKKDVYTVPHGDGWGNRVTNASRVSAVYDTKAEAQRAGREMAIANKSEHIILNSNGQIGLKNSYGHDSCPPKDKR
ncbi:MAG: DUF2188 domain-containing protein [Endomicrobiaceae bacterium]|nr:DUF2188 domain-containing protein [Endomicrobiaceae bacterium]